MAPLFGTVEGRSAREALCNTVRVIGQREALHASLGELVASLNAWDRKRIEEPDFDVRLKVHKEINSILSKGTPPSTDWVLLVLYNCFHFVRKVSDFPSFFFFFVPRDSGGTVSPCHYRWYLLVK